MQRIDSLLSLRAEVLRRRDQGLRFQDGEVILAILESLLLMARDGEPRAPRPDPGPALRIQAAWEAGRACPLAGRRLRDRVLRARRLVEAGLMGVAEADRVAAEAENVALAFQPLPEACHEPR
ncbi:hypothetical protein ACLBXJ_15580 [Methylobacterium mesophilicum]